MEAGGQIAAGDGAIAAPAQAQPSAAQGNDVDAMQQRLNELKNMWSIIKITKANGK